MFPKGDEFRHIPMWSEEYTLFPCLYCFPKFISENPPRSSGKSLFSIFYIILYIQYPFWMCGYGRAYLPPPLVLFHALSLRMGRKSPQDPAHSKSHILYLLLALSLTVSSITTIWGGSCDRIHKHTESGESTSCPWCGVGLFVNMLPNTNISFIQNVCYSCRSKSTCSLKVCRRSTTALCLYSSNDIFPIDVFLFRIHKLGGVSSSSFSNFPLSTKSSINFCACGVLI